MQSTVLAVDFGTHRVGVAISRSFLAEPLVVLSNTPDLLDQLQTICQQEHVTQLVIGLSDQEMAIKTQEFAQKLEAKTQLPISFIDESFSTQTLTEKLKRGPMKQSKRQGPIDHFVAAELLQEWLDTQPE